MAFPRDLSKISTNLSRTNLLRIIKAIKTNKVKWISNSLYEGSCSAILSYRGQKFEINEWYEEVSSLHKVNK